MFCFTFTLTLSFVDYFLVAGPLEYLKIVSGNVWAHTDSIGSFEKNICISSKNRLLVKNDTILRSLFFTWLRP